MTKFYTVKTTAGEIEAGDLLRTAGPSIQVNKGPIVLLGEQDAWMVLVSDVDLKYGDARLTLTYMEDDLYSGTTAGTIQDMHLDLETPVIVRRLA